MLAIFDMSSINLERYNSEILNNYTRKYIAYIDDPDLCKPIDGNCMLVCTAWWRISKIVDHFKKYDVSLVIISGQRPADLRVLVAASALSIPVVYKMHGLYIPYMKRGVSFYLMKLGKSIRTLFYLVDIWFFTRNYFISYGMLMSFIFGRSRNLWAGANELRVKVGLIWSEYWDSWHHEHWAMQPEDGWVIVGNPDTVKFKQVEVDDGGLVYIYQTLIEDGRIDVKLMNQFYDNLQIIAKSVMRTVHVKWHPRGDKKILSELIDRGFRIHSDMPKSDLYIGHYSSLLGMVPLLGGQVIAVELDGHPTPDPIKNISYKVVKNAINDLGVTIEECQRSNTPKYSEAVYYFGDYFDKDIEMLVLNKYLGSSNIMDMRR